MGIRTKKDGGSGEIRTHGGRKPSTVFKTVALNRSATLPGPDCIEGYPVWQAKMSALYFFCKILNRLNFQAIGTN